MRLALLCLTSAFFVFAPSSQAHQGSSAHAASNVHVAKGSIDILGEIDDRTLVPAQKKFDELVAAGEKTVLFRIDTPGGNVFMGLDFINHVLDAKYANNLKIQCVARGKLMSMGLAIYEGICDERYVVPGTMFLAHGAATSTQGNADAIASTLSELKAMNDALAEINSARMNISVQEYHRRTDHQNWFFATQEALAVGAADAVIPASSLPPPSELEVTPDDAMEKLKKLLGG